MAMAFIGLSSIAAGNTCMAQTPEQKLEKLGIRLDNVQSPISAYQSSVISNGFIFLSGKGPRGANGQYITGKVGKDITTAQGYGAARLIAIAQLSELKSALGSLDKVKRIIKVNGYVNSADDFTQQSKVIDGFSDLMIEVFGDTGRHARTSVGVASLPLGMSVEIEAIVELDNKK